jgi:hypothetical protein
MIHSERAFALHSRYNPAGEAEKYVNALVFREVPRFLILMEPGRGYMIPLLARKFPEAKIIVIHAEAQESPDTSNLKIPPTVWEPACGVSLERFLEQEIPDIEAAAVRIIEWRPALALYGEAYRRLMAETVAVIKRLDANKRTTRTFGLRWFKNFFRILGALRTVIYQAGPLTPAPCIVAGAGPSLEEAIPLIKGLKTRVPLLVLGVSSGAMAFRERGLVPDLVIATDGGGWALLHLYEGLRGADRPFGLAVSLFSALPSQAGDTPLLLISDGSLWQRLILKELNLPYISLVQRGTVTASALDLAFSLTAGNVFIAGMDLSHRDIRTHARPYSFEGILEAKASRLNPVYAQTFTRSFGILTGGSYNIYADWFARQLTAYPQRLYSLGENHPVFSGLKPWDAADWKKAVPNPSFGIQRLSSEMPLVQQGADTLIRALIDPRTSEAIRRELGPLLFPDNDKEDTTVEDLCNTIEHIAKAYTGNSYHG